jgi:hypothetical protein
LCTQPRLEVKSAGRSTVRQHDAVDITELILNDHHRQRQAFAVLDDIDRSDTERLSLVWGDLAEFLEVHAAAEELVFYPELLRIADPDSEETKDAIGDHNDIRDAIHEAERHKVGSDGWWTAVGKCRSANTEHMGEEEDEGLADFRRHASLEERDEIGLRFEAAKTAPIAPTLPRDDKDPETYVEEHSEGDA